jgi:hypothetical protein
MLKQGATKQLLAARCMVNLEAKHGRTALHIAEFFRAHRNRRTDTEQKAGRNLTGPKLISFPSLPGLPYLLFLVGALEA